MKNKFMRIAAVTLMLCLVTTCAISGTFAKYTTEASGTDTARVAYWGWTGATMTLDNLFAKTYSTDVKAAEDAIAPGTTGKATFTIAYDNTVANAPEVAYKFDVTASGNIADDIKNNPTIKWAVYLQGTADDAIVWGSWDTMIGTINGYSEARVDAGELPAAFDNNEVYVVAWQWAFEGATTDTDADGITDQDELDTAMGNKTTLDEVKITITIKATQINE